MDEQELLDKIEALEARIDALEKSDDTGCEGDECDDTCPECGENPCICDQIPTEDEPSGEIDADDVEEVQELDFNLPNFGAIESDEDDTVNGLFGSEEEDEDSPYYY